MSGKPGKAPRRSKRAEAFDRRYISPAELAARWSVSTSAIYHIAISDELLADLKAAEESIGSALVSLDEAKTELLSESQSKRASLETDSERIKLVGLQ